jgi:hypothetical protein
LLPKRRIPPGENASRIASRIASKNASKHRNGGVPAGNEKYFKVLLDKPRKYVSINMSAMT